MEPYVQEPEGHVRELKYLDLSVSKYGGLSARTSYEKVRVWSEAYFKDNFKRLAAVKARCLRPDLIYAHDPSAIAHLLHGVIVICVMGAEWKGLSFRSAGGAASTAVSPTRIDSSRFRWFMHIHSSAHEIDSNFEQHPIRDIVSCTHTDA
ncbi:hypothetical protein VPH35_054981 [Triticum aestivum]|uniref:Berberine/berberine-like domain-containing protein n=1 Tax=Triticum aestivum TaxID=4565 RepID=A0A077RYC2_WHEAT|nr:unnamed protein product [Triticum aestivum]